MVRRYVAVAATAAMLVCAHSAVAEAPDTAFTYQGRLVHNGEPVNAEVSLVFRLYDAPGGFNQIGPTLSEANFMIVDGLFTIDLDFGDVFAGDGRWLEVTVNGNVLSPRQPMMPTPYAMYALNADGKAITNLNANALTQGEVPASVLTGSYNLSGSFDGSFTGTGSNITGLNASNVASGTLSDARLSSNVALRNAPNTFLAGNTFSAALTLGTQATGAGHAVRADRMIGTSGGLTGGGNLTANRTLSIANLGVTDAMIANVHWSKVLGAPSFLLSESDPSWSGLANTTSNLTRTGNVSIGTAINSHRMVVATTDADNFDTVRIIGPNTFGHAGRLNFGDFNYVYLFEDQDDRLQIHARVRTSITGGGGGTGVPTPASVRLGLGTLNPLLHLAIVDDDTGLHRPASNTLAFHSNGQEHMRLTSLGRLGIGTSSPATLLHVAGSGLTIRGRSTTWDGVEGWTDTSGAYAVYGIHADGGRGIVGSSSGTGSWAVYAFGNMGASGTKSFLIDHPHDPENKYLVHFAAEGPEPFNIYRGTVTLDGFGEAWVQLPDYFEAINIDFHYQLTAVGAPAPNLHIAAEVMNNEFMIAGGQPGMRVSWMVTGVRNDAYVQHYPTSDVMEKPEHLRGTYQHPETYGLPAVRGEIARRDALAEEQQAVELAEQLQRDAAIAAELQAQREREIAEVLREKGGR